MRLSHFRHACPLRRFVHQKQKAALASRFRLLLIIRERLERFFFSEVQSGLRLYKSPAIATDCISLLPCWSGECIEGTSEIRYFLGLGQ